MIYTDAAAKYDYEMMPARRSTDDKCLNCGLGHCDHWGWYCSKGIPTEYTYKKFDDIPSNNRYLTQSMIDSLPRYPVVNKLSQKLDIEQRVYAFFTTPVAGNCKCNIPRKDCVYHR